ncbi:MAG: sulfatase-like hydrolase/transferase, partial [Bryobacteraceae bacterium]|nr:sulfatase-like hydrolase/transferase [Bryobacteraceae bacterium]
GFEFNQGPAAQAQENFGLPLTETTVAQRLKELGYRTGMFGKWHLGYRPELHPMKRGFDEFFGFLGGAHSYLDARADAANPIYDGLTPTEKFDYGTDEYGQRAAKFIEKNKDQPFFVYVPFNAVHTPMEATPKYLDRFASIADPQRRKYAAMLSALDENVGVVLKTLEKHKLTDKTLVVFLTDNGGPTPVNTSRNEPLHGFKAQVWEGGIRIPWVMQWPGHLPKGKVFSNPVIALDLLPTFVTAAGGKVDSSWKVDGVDLVPHLSGKAKGVPHERLFWRFGRQWAMREGDWKLMSMGDPAPSLFNLRADVGENKDLAAAEPARVASMKAAWDAWNAKNIEARWVPAAQGGQKKKKKKKA